MREVRGMPSRKPKSGAGEVAVLITVPSEEKGVEIARALLEQRLAACVNCLGPIRSLYRWKGEVCDDSERLLIVKSRAALFPRLQAAVLALHPYETPEIVALRIDRGLPAYLKWVRDETVPAPGGERKITKARKSGRHEKV